ncbi:O-antigen ligase family protein [Sphingomonas prati]|uniref:O-antigen ligase n=1 Tax=Sphingomonas prati TaxID=1843237 RepID=A0A7W9BTC4_9SPHN|nr:O-antigen ligase family protein [Sphingomonas prati]MBB5729233.1 O-antigen ligase [Sphingomonas prati]GGE84097.1 hypothetical protein GCM10011404_15960 [Sphingomonas prati]
MADHDATAPARRPIRSDARLTTNAPEDRLPFPLAVALLAGAFLLGGTSGSIPMRGMVIELIALAGIVVALLDRRPTNAPRLAAALILFAVLLPLLQLIPLPPSLWWAMPGRAVGADIARLLLPDLWRPISIDPGATLIAWLAILAPVAMFLLAVRLDAHRRALLLALFVALALLSFLLGLVQVATADGFYLFPTLQPIRLPTGLFSNRNHQAVFMVEAAIAALALRHVPPFRAQGQIALPALALIFAACVFGTASRAGMVLLVVPLLYALLPLTGLRPTRRQLLLGLGAVVVVALLLPLSGVVRSSLARFADRASEGRLIFWPDVVYTARTFFPFGAGLGNFVRAYESTEALATINRFTINRAHNEYLEILIESGVAGLAQIALLAWFVAHRGWRALRQHAGSPTNRFAFAALLMIAVLALHSLVDFPLRTSAHLTGAGLLLALLVPPPAHDAEPDA